MDTDSFILDYNRVTIAKTRPIIKREGKIRDGKFTHLR